MNARNEALLLRYFPFYSRDVLLDRGWRHGDGWFGLMWTLSCHITKILDRMPEERRKQFYVIQVKEKFGGLRFYVQGATPAIYRAIDAAERLSWRICEECGSRGKWSRRGYYIATLCDGCRKKLEKQ